MSNIGVVLGWRYNDAPGICTLDGEITAWPEELGPQPTPEQIAAWTAEYEAASAVPASVTRLQLVRALRARNLFGRFTSALAKADAETREDWTYAVDIERRDPRVEAVGAEMGLDAAGVDALFVDAAGR